MSSSLCLHSGAEVVTLEDVLAVTTPPSTQTHYPIPHEYLIGQVIQNLEGIGWRVRETQWGLNAEGQEMWGVMDLVNGGTAFADYSVAIGIRNAHNKRFSAGVAVGSRVFVCDNLAFSSEIVVFRKHTRWIRKDLSRMLFEALGNLAAATRSQDERIQAYKATLLNDALVHDLLIRAVDAKVMANADLPKVLGHWREPEHDEFLPRNAWSLLNAFTQVGKGWNAFTLTGRTTRLHGLMDLAVEAVGQNLSIGDMQGGRALLPPAPNYLNAGEVIGL